MVFPSETSVLDLIILFIDSTVKSSQVLVVKSGLTCLIGG